MKEVSQEQHARFDHLRQVAAENAVHNSLPEEEVLRLVDKVRQEIVEEKSSNRDGELELSSTLTGKDLAAVYREMAEDEAREAEALEWAEATAGDVGDAA